MTSTAILLLRGGGLRVVSVLVQMAIAFVMMPFLIAHLGDHLYGIWAVVSSLIATYYLLDLGFTSAVTRYVAKHVHDRDDESTNRVVSTAFAIYVGISCLVFLITLGLAAFSEHFVVNAGDQLAVKWLILLMGLTMAFNFPFNAFAGIANAHLRYDLGVYSRTGFAIATSAAYFFLLSHGYQVIAMAMTNLVMSLLSDVVFVYTARYLQPTLRVGWRYVSRDTVKTLFNYSVWAFVSNIAAMLRQGIDSLVIAANLSASSVTHYSIGYRLVEYATHMQLQATNILQPLFTRYHTSGNTLELHNKVVLMTKINTLLAGYCAWMLILVGDHFIHRWMGREYDDAYAVLCVLAVGFAANLTFNPLSNAMFAIAKPKYIAVLDIFEALANVTFSLILVRFYGIIGVAIGTTIPLVLFALGARPITACRQLEMAPRRHYLAVLPMAALAVFLAVATKVWLSPELPNEYLPLVAIGVLTFPFYLLLVINLFFDKWEVEVLTAQIPLRLRPFIMPLLRHSGAAG